ncbi:uncharacterized protein LOC144142581 [Haemaphysalis longicornis]
MAEADLVERLAKWDSTAVPGSSRRRSSSVEVMEEVIFVEDEAVAEVSVPKKRRLALRDDDSTSSSDEEDAAELKRLLRKERKKTQQLRRKLQVIRKTHQRLQEQHSRMTNVLLSMLETSSSTHGSHCQAVLHRQPARQSGNSLPRPVTTPHSQLVDKPAVRVAPQQPLPKKPSDARQNSEAGASVRQESLRGVQNDAAGASVHTEPSHEVPNDKACESARQESSPRVQNGVADASVKQESAVEVQNDVSQEGPQPDGQGAASESLCPFEIVNDQVHLGDGVSVSMAQWERLLSQKRDSLFVKELTKELWGIANLRGRSLTGTPCRRFLHKEPRMLPERRALSPKKIDAVRSAFDQYIAQVQREEPVQRRRAKMNYFIAELLKDINKKAGSR